MLIRYTYLFAVNYSCLDRDNFADVKSFADFQNRLRLDTGAPIVLRRKYQEYISGLANKTRERETQ